MRFNDVASTGVEILYIHPFWFWPQPRLSLIPVYWCGLWTGRKFFQTKAWKNCGCGPRKHWVWSTFNESGFLSRVICRGSNVEGKKSRVTNKKSRVFAKSGFYLIKVSGLLFPKANFLFLVAAKLKRLSLSKHTVIEIHTYRIHTYQQIGEVLQIRNPLRFLTDCSVSL